MSVFGVVFLLSLLASLAFFARTGNYYVLVHGLLLMGALPLMWAAMLHFVPVLTRSGAPSAGMARLPWLGVVGAAIALGAFSGMLPRAALIGAALMLATGAALLGVWALRRARAAFGAPHPGVRWYLAALTMLMLALLMAVAMVALPATYPHAYRAHLHLNLFGWVGLTVWGTLPVLLPTCMSQRDFPRSQNIRQVAASRLRQSLPWALAAVLVMAAGAAFKIAILSLLGGLIWLVIAAGHGRVWLNAYGAPWRWPGPAFSLGVGAAGFALLVLAGGIHGFSGPPGGDGPALIAAYAAGFLLPVVLGALAQLMPVWRFPGPDSAARRHLAVRLARGAKARALLCLAAAAGVWAGHPSLLVLVALAGLWLLGRMMWPGSPHAGDGPPAD